MSLDHLQLADGPRLMRTVDLGDDLSIRLIHLFYTIENGLLRSVIARGQMGLIDHILKVLRREFGFLVASFRFAALIRATGLVVRWRRQSGHLIIV